MEIIHIVTDNWQWLYLDGELKLSDHSLSPEDVLEAIGVPFSTGWVNDIEPGVSEYWENLSDWPDEVLDSLEFHPAVGYDEW